MTCERVIIIIDTGDDKTCIVISYIIMHSQLALRVSLRSIRWSFNSSVLIYRNADKSVVAVKCKTIV